MKLYTLKSFGTALASELRKANRLRTAETYETSLRSFIRFLHGGDVQLPDITPPLVERYEGWLRENGKLPGTISFYLRTLRAIYNRAAEEGLTADLKPFRRSYTGVPETPRRALSLSQLRRLKNFKISESLPSVAFARDMFLMSFYLRGISLVDLAFLRRSDIQGNRLVYRRKKTGRLLTLKWTDEMRSIVERYCTDTTPFLLPIIRSEDFAQKSFRSASHLINRNLHKLSRIMGMDTGGLTFYMARHTWASLARNSGVPISVISAAMGHSSESVTRIYLTSINSSRIDSANDRLIRLLKS